MPLSIADTACVDPSAELADGVDVGPYCIVGPRVRIGAGTRLVGHVCLFGPTSLGRDGLIAPFVTIGRDRATTGSIEIGDGVRIAGGASIDPPASPAARTRIGSQATIAPHAHIAGGCEIAAFARIDAGASLGERVAVGEHTLISAGVTVHPRVTIGELAFVGGPSRVFHDVPPYLLADGHPTKVRGLHLIGLKRRGVGPEALRALHEAHRLLFRGKLEPQTAADQLRARGQSTPEVERLIAFLIAQRDGAHGRAQDHPDTDEQAA